MFDFTDPVHPGHDSTGAFEFGTDMSGDALMFESLITYSEDPQLQRHSAVEDHAHPWGEDLLQGFQYDASSPYTIPNTSHTNVGVSSPHGLETQFAFNPDPSVSYPAYSPVHGGYHIAPGAGGHYDLPFVMSVHPTASRIPWVFHAVPGAQLSPATASATFAPVALSMVPTSGQDLVVDTTAPSIHPHPTVTSSLAPVSSTAAAATPLFAPGPVPELPSPPIVRCMIDNCGHNIAVDKTVLRQHLAIAHGYATPHRSRSVLCRWSGCLCTRPSTCRSRTLGTGHGVHIKDMVEHVWHDHLNFQNVCGKCGDARWARGFSFQRHTSVCGGRKPARCVGCCQLFRSTIALAVHVELGECTGLVFK
jgi:hypothetical protein